MNNPDICRDRHMGADTSVEANKTTPRKSRERQSVRVLECITKAGTHGRTTEEVKDLLKIPYPAASARISELLHKTRKVVDSGLRRATTTGKTARVIVAAGQLRLWK